MIVEVPLHVTGFWLPVYTKSIRTTGSLGVGITLSPGVVCYEGKLNFKIPTTIYVSKRVGEATCRTPAPIGYGFGVSAALALGISLIHKDPLEASSIAHEAEVVNKTGLGDVMSEFIGRGVVIRLKPGPPWVGKAEWLEVPRSVCILTKTVEGFKDTPTMLNALRERLPDAFKEAWKIFERGWDFYSFVEAAERFSLVTGMMKDRERGEGVIGSYVKKRVKVTFVYCDRVEDYEGMVWEPGRGIKINKP